MNGKIALLGMAVAALLLTAPQVQAADVKLEEPIVVTTCGKSPGALMVKLIAKRAGMEAEQNDTLSADDLAPGKYKTLFITMGASGKGLGAAGTDIDSEAKRVKALIDKAHSLGMKVVGTQLEGMSRRTDASDEVSIDAVAPYSDVLIIKEDVDGDGRFTKIAEQTKAPLIIAKQPMEIVPNLQQMFGK